MTLAGERREPSAESLARSPRKHPKPFRRLAAPRDTIEASRTIYNAALRALWPWSVADYPGILKGAYTAMLGRARPYTIRDWRRGTRRAPAWAIQLLIAAIDLRLAELTHARELLSKEKGRE